MFHEYLGSDDTAVGAAFVVGGKQPDGFSLRCRLGHSIVDGRVALPVGEGFICEDHATEAQRAAMVSLIAKRDRDVAGVRALRPSRGVQIDFGDSRQTPLGSRRQD